MCVYHIFHKKFNLWQKRNTISLQAIWKSWHRHLGIGIDIDVGISIGIAKTLFCLATFLYFPFEVSC